MRLPSNGANIMHDTISDAIDSLVKEFTNFRFTSVDGVFKYVNSSLESIFISSKIIVSVVFKSKRRTERSNKSNFSFMMQ